MGPLGPRADAPRPRRLATYALGFMLWMAIFALYSMRANLSIAIHGTHGMAAQYAWGDKEKGVLLSSFFWGYIVSQLPGGFLATRYGGKRVLLVSMVAAVLLTALTPAAAAVSLHAAVACRVLLGVSSGCLFPVLASMLGRWVTDVDRATVFCLADTGGSCGVIFCALLGPYLIETGPIAGPNEGWTLCFYLPAAIGAVWSVLWMLFVTDSPADCGWMSPSERAWVLETLALEAGGNGASGGSGDGSGEASGGFGQSQQRKRQQPVSWRAMAQAPALWGMYLGNMAGNWTWYTILTYLPQYLLEIMGFNLQTSGFIFCVPYICMMTSEVLTAAVTDRVISSGRASLYAVRSVATGVAGLGCAACLVTVALRHEVVPTIVFFGASLAFLAINNSGSFLVGNDLYAEHAGVCMGVSNTLGTIPGIVSPILSGYLLSEGKCPKDEKHHDNTPASCGEAWDVIFYVAAGIYAAFAVTFWALAAVPHAGVGYRTVRGGAAAKLAAAKRAAELVTNATPEERAPLVGALG